MFMCCDYCICMNTVSPINFVCVCCICAARAGPVRSLASRTSKSASQSALNLLSIRKNVHKVAPQVKILLKPTAQAAVALTPLLLLVPRQAHDRTLPTSLFQFRLKHHRQSRLQIEERSVLQNIARQTASHRLRGNNSLRPAMAHQTRGRGGEPWRAPMGDCALR